MRRVGTAVILLALAIPGAGAGTVDYRLLGIRSVSDPSPRRLEKILVVGISDDREVRNRFEDKFVSQLRGRGVAAMTSHSFVPDLTAIGDRDRILEVLQREGVDGVMTVRAVGLDGKGEERWAAAWEVWLEEESTPRELIERSVPVVGKPSKRYGIEFALWDVRTPRRLWAARTGVHTRKELRSGVADLLRLVMDDLKDARWLGGTTGSRDK